MNQQINLYLPEFRQNTGSLTANQALKWLALMIVVLFGGTAFELWGTARFESELSLKQQEVAASTARTEALLVSFGEQYQDPRLATQVLKLEEGLAEKETLLRFLEGKELGNTGGFSEFLADLSRYHVPGLRITGLDLKNGGSGVLLRGEVLRAEYVPLFLQNLRQGKSYKGKNFETLKIEGKTADQEDATLVMSFDVATTGTSRN